MLLITVQTGGNKQGCIGDIICTFHKAIMYSNILITPESQYSYRKRTPRGHIMFVFKTDAFPQLHCTPESY